MSPSYDIEILYREPTYELRGPEREEPFSWTYEVTASSPEFAFEEALARFREMAADSGVSWIRKVVLIRVRPITPHAMELGPPERSRVLQEPEDEETPLEQPGLAMLRKIQEELEEELLIILWTRLRDAYLGSERSGGETNELEESLRVPERVKLWEWRGMYDRVAREYLDSSAGHQLMLAVDEVDSAGAREAWRTWFLEELEAIGKSAHFVAPLLTLATSLKPVVLDNVRRVVELCLENRYASGPGESADEPEEVSMFRAFARFLRSRRRKAEARRELEQQREEEADRRRREDARQEHLREQDPMVDLILKSLLLAKLDLERLLDRIDKSAPRPEDFEHLQQWQRDHAKVRDFLVFEAICRCFPAPGEDDPYLEIDEIRRLLEHQCDDMTCFGYADEKLGIRRELRYCDDMNRSWVEYERADGRFEMVHRRLDRIRSEIAKGA
jgi:hypothetical protein